MKCEDSKISNNTSNTELIYFFGHTAFRNIEITENKCEGLVRVSSIKNDHYIFDEKKYALIGYRTKVSYQLGQKVKIKIQKADLERKQMDLVL